MPTVFICEAGWEAALADELRRTLPGPSACELDALPEGRVVVKSEPRADAAASAPIVAFASQVLPDAEPCAAASISQWADAVCERISARLDQASTPWRLHVFATPFADGSTGAGRTKLVRDALVAKLREVRRRLLRRMNEAAEDAWLPGEALVQVLLTSPTEGFVSIAEEESRRAWRYCLSPFVGGMIEPAVDKLAPSRAFAKLVEAELRLGRKIQPGETCVDLGSAPGSWAYTALERGALVTAIDRSPLRDDLMSNPRLTFLKTDAFEYFPSEPVDWLLSDIIAFPDRICELLARWLGERHCRAFCVTVKFRGRDDDAKLESVKDVLRGSGYRFGLRRLTANKNEACAYGEL
ncbi:MAG: hypothetical protein C0483_15655 [Pirellula sp.]|nr:hypothetical protein [Pirellula sp.]